MANSRSAFSDLDRALAGYLIGVETGQQILSTREMAEAFQSSLGSISAAMNHLEETGVIAINRRGRLGSFLEHKSIGALWNVVENGPMVIALTLPSFLKCEGLATGIYSLLNRAGVEIYLIFIRGSFNRIKALRHGQCHATVISALAADELCGPEEEIVMRLPPQSFVEEHQVFIRQGAETAGHPLVVGYDPESYDVKFLTELEFAGSNVTLQPMTFTQIDLHLEDSPVDAAITNGDFTARLAAKGFLARPLSARTREIVGDRYTSAVLVARAAASPAGAVLSRILDPSELLTIQEKVVAGRMVPRY